MRWVVMVMAAGLMAGCSARSSATAPEPVTSAPSVAAPSASPSPPPSSPPASSSSPGFTVALCTAEDEEAMTATITGQQAAFADADFARARSFASDSFRSYVTVREFEALIEREYGFLLSDPAVEVEKCAQVESVGEVQVRVGDTTPRTMIYRLVRERGTWAIDGARITSAPSGIAA